MEVCYLSCSCIETSESNSNVTYGKVELRDSSDYFFNKLIEVENINNPNQIPATTKRYI